MPEPITTTPTTDQVDTAPAGVVAESSIPNPETPAAIQEQGLQVPPQPAWIESLPEELRAHDDFKGKELAQVAKDYLELKEKVPIVPESPAAYELTVPEGMSVNQPLMEGFKDVAHKAGLTKEQASAINDYYNGSVKVEHERALAETETAKEALRAEWGDAYAKNLEFANLAFAKFVPEKLRGRIIASGEGRNPDLIKAFLAVSQAVSESAWAEPAPPKPTTVQRTEGGSPVLAFPSMASKGA